MNLSVKLKKISSVFLAYTDGRELLYRLFSFLSPEALFIPRFNFPRLPSGWPPIGEPARHLDGWSLPNDGRASRERLGRYFKAVPGPVCKDGDPCSMVPIPRWTPGS